MRAWCLLGAAAVAVLAAYVSLVPFRFALPADGVSWLEHVGRSFEIGTVSRGDSTVLRARGNLLANLVMFVPFGFCAAGALVDDRSPWRRWLAAAVAITGASLAVSVAIEAAQAFAPGRTPSLADIAAQAVGTAVGLVGWRLLAGEVRFWSARVGAGDFGAVRLMLGLYSAVRLLLMLLPLDVTVDPGTLAGRVRNGLIVVNPLRSTVLAWEALPSAIADLVMAVPVGACAALIGVPRGSRRAAVPAFLLGASAFAAAELAQVFIQSRTADIVDLAVAVAGVALGVAMVASLAGASTPAAAADRRTLGQRLARPAGLVLASALYVLYNWTPFDFTLSRELVASRLDALWAVPFAGYYQNPEFKALADLGVKLSMSLPLGVLVQLAVRPDRHEHRRFLMLLVVGGAVMFFGGVEAGQVLLPSRYPDLTDVLIAVVGLWVGLRLTRQFERRDT